MQGGRSVSLPLASSGLLPPEKMEKAGDRSGILSDGSWSMEDNRTGAGLGILALMQWLLGSGVYAGSIPQKLHNIVKC